MDTSIPLGGFDEGRASLSHNPGDLLTLLNVLVVEINVATKGANSDMVDALGNVLVLLALAAEGLDEGLANHSQGDEAEREEEREEARDDVD